VRLTPQQLAVAGATSTPAVAAVSVGLPAAAAGAALAASALDGGVLVAAALFTLLTVVGALLVSGAGALGTLVSAWGFELSASGDDLHVAQGLFDRRQHTMPRNRLQHARVVDNPLRRALGTVSVQLHSGATPGHGDEQQGFIDIPVVRRAQLADLLAAAMGSDDFRPPPLEPRPPAARRRAIVRRTALTAAVAAAIAVAWWPAGAASLPLALLGVPWGRAAHRRAGSALSGRVLAVASGVVVHHLELVPAGRVQSARTSESPLQRRVGLATLHLDVAGGSGPLRVGAPGLGDLAADVAVSAMRRVTRRP
jgi:putative membrane protein